jgi:hypothetical protein
MKANYQFFNRKAVILLFIFLSFFSLKGFAQVFINKLEQYNFHYLNPAYIISDARLQIDVISFNSTMYESKGLQSNIILNIPRKNSGFGIGYIIESMFQSNFSSLHIDYAYKHSFTENLSLTGGVRLNYGKYNFNRANFIDFKTINKTWYSTTIGTTFRYKKIHAGASIGIPLINRKKYYISENETESVKDIASPYIYQILCGYSLGKRNKILFDPILSIQNSYEEKSWYLGANTLIKNFVGVGFTFGDITSFSTSLNYKNKVSLILGIYSKQQLEYTLNVSEMNIIGQIRIKL